MEKSIIRMITLLARKNQICLSSILKQYNLNVTELPFYMALKHNEGMTQDELSNLICVDKALTTRAMKSLEQKEMIIRKTDKSDKRIKRVYLTECAKKQWKEIYNALLQYDEVILNCLSEEEQKNLQGYIQSLSEQLENLYGMGGEQ